MRRGPTSTGFTLRTKTLSSLKKKLWKLFSEYVRRSASDEGGTLRCYTCGKLLFWKEAHAGHFVPGRKNAVLFNEDVVRPQCPRCNIFEGGAYHRYTLNMVRDLGKDRVEELLALKHKVLKYTRSDLEGLIDVYKKKLERLDAKGRGGAR